MICIQRKADGLILAQTRRADDVIELEGNVYFNPACVNAAALEISDRTYVCPYKGTCFWVDTRVGTVWINDVAWVYPTAKPGYRKIAGWYGFYPEHAAYRKTSCEPAVTAA